MNHALPLLVGLAMVCAVAVLLRMRGSARPERTLVRKRLLTRSENDFFAKLVGAAHQAGGFHVCPQVSMGAVMEPHRGLDQRERIVLRNRFSSKIIDFVLMDRDGEIRLLIELDDPSHRGREDRDRARDAMTMAAGLKTMRIPDGRQIGHQTLAEAIRREIQP